MDEIIKNFGLDWHQFGAEFLNFLVVFGLIFWFFYKKLLPIIEKRQKIVNEGLDKALRADEILETAEKDREKIIKEAKEEAIVLKNGIIDKAKNIEKEIIDSANNKSNKIISDSKKIAEEEKIKIINSSKKDIAKMIILGAEKILEEK